MTTPARIGRRGMLAAGLAVLTLAAGSTIAIAAASGALGHSRSASSAPHLFGRAAAHRGASCTASALPGSIVDVRLADMGAMMGGGNGPMMSGNGWQSYPGGTMRLVDSPGTVAHGQVSFRVTNVGMRTHELVVLPLADGQQPGQRAIGSDRTVDESGSLGEASASCAGGEGDGITAGSTSWVTLHLPAGRYELVCNLPGHYAAGMFAELDVV